MGEHRPVAGAVLGTLLQLACLASASLPLASAAVAQRRVALDPGRELSRLARLETQLQTGEFVQWGNEIVLYTPRELTFRWGPPGVATVAQWQLYEGEIQAANLLANGPIGEASDPSELQWFRVDLRNLLPPQPTGVETYRLRVVPGTGIRSSPVTITYRVNTNQTHFSDFGLYPELRLPMRVKVHLQNFHILDADEESGEEPYIIPMIAYMDGTTIDPANLPQSSVRVDRALRHDAHGNLPTSNDQGSGSSISIPSNVGYYEESIRLVGLEIIENCDPGDMGSCLVTLRDLMEATTVWVFVVALEEDESPTPVINSTRHAIVDAFKAQFEQCVTGLSFANLLGMLNGGFDPQAALASEDESVEFCGRSPQPDPDTGEIDTILDQIRSSMKTLALDRVIEDTFLNPTTFLHGLGGVYALNQAFDSDDVIGFAHRAFTFEQLARADGPIPFDLEIRKSDNSGVATAGVNPVHYKIQAVISRCHEQLDRGRCENVDEALYP